MAAASNSAPGSILFHIAGIILPPFFLAISTLLAIDKVLGEFLSMVISAASLLARCGTANPLIRVVLARAEFLFAIGASLGFHAYD